MHAYIAAPLNPDTHILILIHPHDALWVPVEVCKMPTQPRRTYIRTHIYIHTYIHTCKHKYIHGM